MKTQIISEIGINHNGDLDTALTLIEKSKEAGADAVKFQKRNLDKIYSKDILDDPNSAEWNFEYLIPLLKDVELNQDEYFIINKKCKELGIDLIITPFDEDSADFINKLDLSAIKIASADMTNLNLIKKCSSFDLPLIISTGMWDYDDIKKCVSFYKKNNIDFSLLLTNSTYPAPYESVSLKFIDKLKKLTNNVGYSGHERGIFIPVAAVSLGATIVEKHITLDVNQEGPDHKASLLPGEFKQMVQDIRNTELSLGEEKHVNQAETLNKEVFAKSAVSVRDIIVGETLSEDVVEFKSPGKGIFPHEMEKFYGKELKRFVKEGKYISENDFKKLLNINQWGDFDFYKKWGVKCRFHDYDDYKILKSPVMEFHMSETDLDLDFDKHNVDSELIIHAPEVIQRKIFDLCTSDKSLVELSLKTLQKTIDKTLNIAKRWPKAKPKLVVHMGGMSMSKLDSYSNDEMINRAIDNFKKLNYNVDDIEILPENLPSRPWYLGGEWYQYGFAPVEDMIKFCDYFGLKLTYDICHAALHCNESKKDLLKYTRQIKNYVSHLHISDARGINAEGVQIGEGTIDFRSVFDILTDIDYSWVTEIWSGHLHNGEKTFDGLCCLNKNYKDLI
jgi:N-acetylneuraminate synthase